MSIIRCNVEVLNGSIYLGDEYLGSCVPFHSESEEGCIAITCAHVLYGDGYTRTIDNINNVQIRTVNGDFISTGILTNEDDAKKYDVIVLRIEPLHGVTVTNFMELNVCKDVDASLLNHEHALIVTRKNETIISSIPITSFNRNLNENSYEAEVDKMVFYDIDNGRAGAKVFKGVSGSGLFVTIEGTICLAGILSKIPKSSVTSPIVLQKVDAIINSLVGFNENNIYSLMPQLPKIPTANLKDVCFNHFTMKSKNFYHVRSCDNLFNSYIEHGLNIWMHGLSGSGKTALIISNLMKSETKYIYCDLQPVSIKSANDIWTGVVDEISFKQSVDYDGDDIGIRSLCHYLLRCDLEDDIVLIIDEMSCDDVSIINDFCEAATSLVGYYGKQSAGKNIIFVISSIFHPRQHNCNKGKFVQLFEMLCSNEWAEDIDKLFDIQNTALGSHVCGEGKKIIIAQCNYLPRLLTLVTVKVYRNGHFDLDSILTTSKSVAEEYNAYD